MSDKELGIGIIGCGGFGMYALEQFTKMPGIRLAAASDVYRPAAENLARHFGLAGPSEQDELIANPDVDIVYLATPPWLHHEQAMSALGAGKHVISEKPLAMNVAQADEMIALANENGLLLIANLMQRYNPLFDTVKRIIDSKVLGDVLHGFFENYATDECLGPDHWFWDPAKSGGIFIEHGVHFFDMLEGWLGEGTVDAAQVSVRPGTTFEDQVQCSVRYRDGIMVNFYHGFTQVGRMDRQELRLLFERGDVTLYEWIPTVMKLRAVVDESTAKELSELLPGARVEVTASYEGEGRAARGHHKDVDVAQMIEVYVGEDDDKMERYAELLRSMITDQTAWIRDHAHERRITERNGRESVALAEAADKLAHGN